MDSNNFSRKTYSLIFDVVGIALIILGFILKSLHIKKIFDLPIITIFIGIGILIYGLFQLTKINSLGPTMDMSKGVVKRFLLNNAILLALLVLVVIIAIKEPRFMQMRVVRDILAQSSTRLIIALGICFTLLIGGTDLSAGRMVGLAAVLSASMMQTADYSNRFFPDLPQVNIILPLLAALVACMLFGVVNGTLVAQFGMHPFIATLAVQVIIYGACSLYVDMEPNNSQPIGGIRPDFAALGQKMLFGKIPILIPIALAFTLLIWFILNKTVFGKNVYAVGGNRQAAVVSGINVKLTLTLVFVLAAAMYAIGGVLEAARTAGATNNYGTGYELDAIAACVVGGVSLNGGVGKVRGIVVGVLIFTVIQYGLSFIGLNPQWQQVIKGCIIAIAVAIDLSKYRSQ